MKLPIIGFVGMSHLGLNYAVATACKKFKVICYDEDISKINLLKKKVSPIFEKNLEKNIKLNFSNLKFTNNILELKQCDNVYISEDVKTKISGESDLITTKKLIDKTIKYLNKNSNLIVLCQVPPGFCRSINWNKNQLFYQVETLIFGQALERALYPERLIIGIENKKNKIKKSYLNLLKTFNCPLIIMNYESAELAKISINMYLISTVTTTNVISEICEKIDANWKDISIALKLDKRIGKYSYLEPGLGISGGNLERDLYTFHRLQDKNNLNNKFILELKKKSIDRKLWILNIIRELKKKYKLKSIAILGLAYKVGTHSIKNSPGVQLIKRLKDHKIKAFDPIVKKIDIIKNLKICKNSRETIKGCDILIITTPWKDFKKINSIFLKKNIKNKIIIDPYNLLDKDVLLKNGINHISMGVKNDV
ncbi:nucleotide sugar dehydrogenase [Candidatus Pelagibacter sp.]|nr:nucleotide sugar dehydrogenase [Candidatus Pelagibacter sp.]